MFVEGANEVDSISIPLSWCLSDALRDELTKKTRQQIEALEHLHSRKYRNCDQIQRITGSSGWKYIGGRLWDREVYVRVNLYPGR